MSKTEFSVGAKHIGSSGAKFRVIFRRLMPSLSVSEGVTESPQMAVVGPNPQLSMVKSFTNLGHYPQKKRKRSGNADSLYSVSVTSFPTRFYRISTKLG